MVLFGPAGGGVVVGVRPGDAVLNVITKIEEKRAIQVVVQIMGSVCSPQECFLPGASTPRKKLEPLTLTGSAEEIGLRHGIMLKDKIKRCWDFYYGIFTRAGWKDEELKTAMKAVAKSVQKAFPHYDTEIQSIAKGSGLEIWQVILINKIWKRDQRIDFIAYDTYSSTVSYYNEKPISYE
eukprot:jgi/Bigna1/137656/aug1.40_g12364